MSVRPGLNLTPPSETGLQWTDSDGPHCRRASGGHLHLKLPVQFPAFTNQPKKSHHGPGLEKCDKTVPASGHWWCSKARSLWRPMSQK